MELWIGALNLGFLYAFMTMGVFFTFRIHDFPDITVDGSFTSGAATAAVLLISGYNPVLALAAAFIVGGLAGAVTAYVNTRFNVNGLLAGILVMTGLYSINLHIMGRSNIPLLNQTTVFTWLEKANPGMHAEIWTCIVLVAVMAAFWLTITLFLKTDLGIAMRATGNNPVMASANGVNVGWMTIFGVAVANGMVGISGGLVAQYQGFADIGMGIGTVVIGLAAVIIGESVLRLNSIAAKVASVVIGSVIFRLIIAFALYVGMNPIDLKLLTAVFVFFTLVASKYLAGRKIIDFSKIIYAIKKVPPQTAGGILMSCIVLFGAGYGLWLGFSKPAEVEKKTVIGVMQFADNDLLNSSCNGFLDEIAKLGWQDGRNCTLVVENAHGDQATVLSIIDKFLSLKADICVAFSTQCLQPAVNKIKDRPVIFGTIASPFRAGAGTTETDHLPNVTGVYGAAPMDRHVATAQKIIKAKLVIGAIWNPALANSVFNVENLQKAVAETKDVRLEGATVTGTGEVFDAALALVQKGVNVFILPPDHNVYAAFQSVVKAAGPKKIPVFVSDTELLKKGALVAIGYDYENSGRQTARLVDRVLKGESPARIPFEKYAKLTFGINAAVARELGVTVPDEVLRQATAVLDAGGSAPAEKPRIGIVQFALEPNVELCKEGISKALADHGYVDGKNIEIVYGNAQADFPTITTIVQDFLRRKVAIITPLSTPCVQAAVKLAASGNTRVVFTYIYDPYRIGAAKTPADHLPNMTGIACFPPVAEMLGLIQEMLPGKKKVGVVWNSSEANSEAVLLQLREQAKKRGLEIVEATVTSPAEVLEASRSLVLKGAEVFLCSGDNTVNVGYDSFQKAATEARVPVFSFDSEFIEKGALAILGPDYYQTGYEGGEYLARVLKGENTAVMPIRQTQKTNFVLNPDAARALGIPVAPALLKKAAIWQKDSKQAGKKLALFLFSDHMLIRETAQGIQDELAESGTLKKFNLTVDVKNAQNEFHLAQSIAQEIVSRNYDYIITVTTPALQATANANANKKIPHVFGAVTDPYRMGVAKNNTEHIPNITGIATVEPVERTIQVMREIFPQAKRIGIVWNPGEACSETCTYKARGAAKQYGFELLEATVSTTAEVRDALNSLLGKIDLFITSGDNTAIMALESTAALLRKHKIPYFTNSGSDIERGSFISIGPDYYQIGRETARMAERVIQGEKPAAIPIRDYAPDKVFINFGLVKEYGISLPDSVLRQAANAPQPGQPSTAGPRRLAVFRFSDNALLLEINRGFSEYLEQSGAEKKYNLTIDTKSAQNEFSMAQSILQDIVRQNYDYLVTFSTPALQVAAQVNKTIPHVFGGVTDPYRMGVAKNPKEHLPQLTGVATFQPVGSLFKTMREIFPAASRVGIVWNPGEACSEACTFKARVAAKEYGFELIEATVTSTSEVIDAARTIINKKIDLFVTSGDNTVILAFDMIAAALHQARIPYCTNTPADVDRGAFLSVGADYVEVGRETAKMALRVMAGEDPKDIPINNCVPEKTAINRGLAREYGVALPDAVVKRAAQVKD